MDSGRQLAWRSAVVPVPAKGRVRVGTAAADSTDPREQAIATMVRWCHEGEHPLWLVEGGAGAGKTRLATDVADCLVLNRWPCGWARPAMGAFAVSAAARNGKHALVLIDDAETRADMFEVLTTIAQDDRPAGIRVIIMARDFGQWWTNLLARLSPTQRDLVAGRTVMGSGVVHQPSPRAVAIRGPRAGSNALGAAATLRSADQASAAVLLHQAAVIVALSTRVGQLGPADIRSALRDLFEEEGYWQRTGGDIAPAGGQIPALRSALTSTAVLGIDGLAEAATVLRRVPALAAGAAARLARLAVWWHGLFTPSGESAAATVSLPDWLATQLPDGSDSTGISWLVAALDAERRATSTLKQLAQDAHRDIWPSSAPVVTDSAAAMETLRRAVTLDAPVDEALAWLTQELELTEGDLVTLGDAISYPTRSLSRTAIVLARRLLDTTEVEEDRASLALELGARYSEVGRWQDARHVTASAVETFRKLTESDRDRYLPELASAVSNLGSCLAQLGERIESLNVAYEAVALYRELLDRDRERYLPWLARALTNLSACMSRAGQRPAALGAVSQAVAIYRELMLLHPTAYATEMKAAEHNLRVCQDAVGHPVAGRPAS